MIDFCTSEDAVVLDDELDLIIQQIDMLFSTTPMDVIGCPNYGSAYERFIYDLSYPTSEIKRYAESQLEKNVEFFGNPYDVNVSVLNGEYNDIILLEVNIYVKGHQYQKIYKVE